jgi:DnaJ-class molecular chaperone
MDYYNILEITKEATDTEIKKAYRGLSLRYHPDRPNGNSEKFKEISEAYETLSNPDKKQQYDGIRDTEILFNFSSKVQPNTTEEMQNIHEIFGQIFGNVPIFHHIGGKGIRTAFRPMFSQIIKPATVNHVLTITLKQAFTGFATDIQITCMTIKDNVQTAVEKKISVEIPQGIDNEDSIILEEQGSSINGVLGNIRVIVLIETHPDFIRKDLDLIYNKTITLKESLCGFMFNIPLLNGKILTLKNTAGQVVIKNDYKQTCQNYGMVKKDNTGQIKTGQLIIFFTVEFPESLTSEQKEKLASIL